METTPSVGIISHIVPWFGLLPVELRLEMWQYFRANHHGTSHVFPHGRDNQKIHLILQGRVKFYYTCPRAERSLTLFILGPGQLFPLLDMAPEGSSLTAVDHQIESIEPIYTVSAPLSLWKNWVDQSPSLLKSILAMYAWRSTIVAQKLEELALSPVSDRIMGLLQKEDEITQKLGFSQLEGLNQTNIAEQIGTSRVHLSRALKQLESSQKIIRLRGQISIKEPKIRG